MKLELIKESSAKMLVVSPRPRQSSSMKAIDDDREKSRCRKKSSLLMTKLPAKPQQQHRRSLFFARSCNARRLMGSLSLIDDDDKCPTASPSPLYSSPASTFESSCNVHDDVKILASLDEIEPEPTKEKDDHNGGEGASKNKKAARCEEPMQTQFMCTEADFDSVGTTNYYADDDDGRLQAVAGEQEEEETQGGIRRYQRAHHSSRRFSSERSSYDGSGYENSDIESVIEERIKSAAQARSRQFRADSAATSRKNKLAAKLNTLKETRTMKIMNSLKREEAAIDKWENKKINKAKMDMKELEMKLENKRDQAMQEMQRKIRRSQKEAERKKAKERAAASKKIARVAEAFSKTANTGKPSCCLTYSSENL